MCAWNSGGFKSCDALLKRVEENDPKLETLVILPMKTFSTQEVTRLADAIGSGKNSVLKCINASGHALPPIALSLVASSIVHAYSVNEGGGIESLAVGDSNMGDEGVASLCEPFVTCNGGRMVELDLSYKGACEKGFHAIGQAFGSSRNLSKLDLSRNCEAGDDGVVALCDAAQRSASSLNILPFQSLTFLDLSDCRIGSKGVKFLAESFSGYGEGCCTEEGSVAIGGSASDLTRLPLVLLLNSNPYIGRSPDALYAFSKFLQPPNIEFSHLTSLSLARCDINDDGIKAFCRAVDSRGCRGLTSLDLSHNLIRTVGARCIADALACTLQESTGTFLGKFATLRELNLAGNCIEANGVAAIAATLMQRDDFREGKTEQLRLATSNDVLQVLDLSKTCCGQDGAAAILKCCSLSSLRLFDNNLCNAGFEHICPLLKGGHPSLTLLDLGGNRAEDSAVGALLDSLMGETNWVSLLRVFELGGNKIGPKSEESLKRLKRAYPKLDIARDRPNQSAI